MDVGSEESLDEWKCVFEAEQINEFVNSGGWFAADITALFELGL